MKRNLNAFIPIQTAERFERHRDSHGISCIYFREVSYDALYETERTAAMGFTHFDENGKAVMVDVTAKPETVREAAATGKIIVNREAFQAIKAGTVGKGDVLGVAATAGIMGAKRTSDLIPMCHILPITNCKINFDMDVDECAIYCTCTVKVTGKTGVEMEALTGVSVALLTIYDMCKSIDKTMEIGEIYLVKKTGGKSGNVCNDRHTRRAEPARETQDSTKKELNIL